MPATYHSLQAARGAGRECPGRGRGLRVVEALRMIGKGARSGYPESVSSMQRIGRDVVVLKRELHPIISASRETSSSPEPTLMDLYSQKEFSSPKRLSRSTKRTIPTNERSRMRQQRGSKSGGRRASWSMPCRAMPCQPASVLIARWNSQNR